MPPARAQLTAIVVSYDSESLLAGCIDSLSPLAPAEVIVVDNASRDSSALTARSLGARVLVNRSNLGFGAACNVGGRAAKSELLAFVNPDVRLEAVDAARLDVELAARPLGLLAPRAHIGEDDGHLEHSLKRTLPWPCNVAREALGPVLPRGISSRLASHVDAPGRRSWLSGALLFCAREEFLSLGGFDERLFLYYEDQELSRRYRTSGLPLSVTDAIAARHARGGSSLSAEDGARAIPRAASALSSVELAGIMAGPRRAYLAWALYRALRRCARAIVRLTSMGPLADRSCAKSEELELTDAAVSTLVRRSSHHYPFVKRLARSAIEDPRAHRRAGVAHPARSKP